MTIGDTTGTKAGTVQVRVTREAGGIILWNTIPPATAELRGSRPKGDSREITGSQRDGCLIKFVRRRPSGPIAGQ